MGEPSLPEYGPPAFAVGGWFAGVTVSVSLAVLLPGLGSLVVLETVAVFVWLAVVELGTVESTVTVAEPPEAIVPSAQVKLGLPVQVPCEGVTVLRVKPAGQMSDRVTDAASDGPPFEIVIV